jgi:hypothetical protein
MVIGYRLLVTGRRVSIVWLLVIRYWLLVVERPRYGYRLLVTDVRHGVDFYSLFRALRETRAQKGLLWSDVPPDGPRKGNSAPKSLFWRRGSFATNVLRNLRNIS